MTGFHATIGVQHDTDCTFHKEPAMLQAPSFKHLAHGLQGLPRHSIDTSAIRVDLEC